MILEYNARTSKKALTYFAKPCPYHHFRPPPSPVGGCKEDPKRHPLVPCFLDRQLRVESTSHCAQFINQDARPFTIPSCKLEMPSRELDAIPHPLATMQVLTGKPRFRRTSLRPSTVRRDKSNFDRTGSSRQHPSEHIIQ